MKKRLKKAVVILLIVMLSMTCCGTVFASNLETVSGYKAASQEQISEIKGQIIEVPITTEDQESRGVSLGTAINLSLSRQAVDSELVTVYWTWTGTDLISGLRAKSIKIHKGSILFDETYATLLPSTGQTYLTTIFPSAASGYATIDQVNIPTDVDRVKITVKDLYAYDNGRASWMSCTEPMGTWTIE